MKSLEYALDAIKILSDAGVNQIKSGDEIVVIPKPDNSALVSISRSEVSLNGKNLNSRITPSKVSKLDTRVDLTALKAFINEVTTISQVDLNHFGVSYYCNDLETEIENLKKILGDSELYEEDSGIPTTKWLFAGNVLKPSEPMFELVLNERSKPVLSSWVPHFQIDIDTSLASEDLMSIITQHLGADWVKWTIDVKGAGIPLVMGRLCSIDGLKVYLAIGTNRRDRDWHRKIGMKEI